MLTLTETRSFPCQVEFHDLASELRADPAGKVENILWSVARDSRGRYYTATGFGQVVVWSPEGKVLQRLGREGSGPGEFKKGSLLLAVDALDNLYVRDNNLRIAIFSPDLKLLRTVGANGVMGISSTSQFLAPSMLLVTDTYQEKPDWKFFHVYDLTVPSTGSPPIIRAFGDVPVSERGYFATDRMRAVTAPVAGQFWSGPPMAAGRGYELQLWSVDGTLIRTIRRDVPWFRKGSDINVRDTHTDEESTAMPRPASAVSGVRDDGHGLLLVSVRVTNDKWDAALAARSGGAITPQLDSMRMRATDIYFEVIDVNAGVVLASSGPMPGERVVKESVRGWFRLGWAGYRLAEDADGLPVVKMMEVRLKGR